MMMNECINNTIVLIYDIVNSYTDTKNSYTDIDIKVQWKMTYW